MLAESSFEDLVYHTYVGQPLSHIEQCWADQSTRFAGPAYGAGSGSNPNERSCSRMKNTVAGLAQL